MNGHGGVGIAAHTLCPKTVLPNGVGHRWISDQCVHIGGAGAFHQGGNDTANSTASDNQYPRFCVHGRSVTLAAGGSPGEMPGMDWWNRNKSRFEALQREYGKVALGTYLVLWAAVLIASGVAIKLGYEFDGMSETGGILLGSWVAAKVTQPFRIAATVALTPLVAKILRRAPAGSADTEDA